jgi:hypothetical protein
MTTLDETVAQFTAKITGMKKIQAGLERALVQANADLRALFAGEDQPVPNRRARTTVNGAATGGTPPVIPSS